jgi:hypothetical protein
VARGGGLLCGVAKKPSGDDIPPGGGKGEDFEMNERRSPAFPCAGVSTSRPEKLRGLQRRKSKAATLTLVILILAIAHLACFELCADAGIVYGRVYKADGQVESRGHLVFLNSGQHQAVIENGSYRIFLPEGVYRVQLGGRECWAEIVSYPRPMRQDIHLECQGGGDHE